MHNASNSDNSIYQKIYTLLKNKQYQNALTDLAVYPKKYKTQTEWLYLKSKCLSHLQYFEEADLLYRSIPNWENIYKVQLGLVSNYRHWGQAQNALFILQKLLIPLRNDPRMRDYLRKTYLEFAYCYQLLKNPDQGIEFAKAYIQITQDNRLAKETLGHLYEMKAVNSMALIDKEYYFKKAINCFNQLINLDPKKELLLSLGRVYQTWGHNIKSSKYFETAINTFKRINNWKTDYEARLAILHCQKFYAPSKTLSEAALLLQQYPNDKDLLLLCGRKAQALGQYKKAMIFQTLS